MLAGQPRGNAMALTKNTEDVIARARHGDPEAFRLIFERYARPILSFIYDLVGQRELAEDLTQEAFVRAYRGLHALRDEARLSTWLFGIARNVARESFRSRPKDNRKVEMDDDQVTRLKDDKLLPDGQLLNRELNGVIHEALEKLDEDKRVVFALKVFYPIFAADGRTVASESFDNTVRLWDLATGKELRRLKAQITAKGGGGYCHVAFSPDQKTLALGPSDNRSTRAPSTEAKRTRGSRQNRTPTNTASNSENKNPMRTTNAILS